MKKTMKRSLLLVIVIALFAAITLTASAIDDQPIFTPIDEPMCTAKGGHVQSEVLSLEPATIEADGKYGYFCVNCNMPMDCENIPKVDANSLKLSVSEYVYDGSAKAPSLNKIKDIDGKVLVKNKDYKVNYQSGRTNPGKYTVKITFMGNYEGTTKLTFSILPKTVSDLKSTAQTTSAITLSWSKVTGATGYHVYKYNTSTKKYEKIKTLTANSYKATGLKDNTTYKFKVRSYTKAADGTILNSGYSSVCSAKTKIIYSVNFAENSGAVYAGETIQINATTSPAGKALTWKSSDTSIAKVSSSGKVTTLKSGTATITAYFKHDDKTYKATYTLTVNKPSVKLNLTSYTITEGELCTLTATTDPADLTVTWKSSNTSVATVSETGKVTGIKSGNATITASTTYKGITYKTTCKITVKTIAENITTLIDFIKENGLTKDDGNKFIRYIAGDELYAITYNEKKDCLEFFFSSSRQYGEEYVTAVLDRSGTWVDFETWVFDLDYYGNVKYAAKSTKSIKASEFTSGENLYNSWDYNSFPSYDRSYVTQMRDLTTGLAVTGWNLLVLFNYTGLWITDIGFINYD